jgi:hypothetical protein
MRIPDAGCTGDPRLCQICGPSVETLPCPICEDENCCETYAACKNDPTCDAYAQCMRSCPLPTFPECVAECDAQVSPAACDTNEACARRQMCVGTCAGSALCIDECDAAHPDGREFAAPLDECSLRNCLDPCT